MAKKIKEEDAVNQQMNPLVQSGVKPRSLIRVLLSGIIVTFGLVGLQNACQVAVCANANYSQAECRVLAENTYSRIASLADVELRLQSPDALDSRSWDARGTFEQDQSGNVHLRVSTLGDLALSLTAGDQPRPFSLVLNNVDRRMTLYLGNFGVEQMLLDTHVSGLQHRIELTLQPNQELWLRGRMDCPPRYRLVAMGDIQTNPLQFQRLIEQLHKEYENAQNSGEPLLGVMLLGDLAESSSEPELRGINDILAASPVPVAVVPGNHDVYSNRAPHYNRIFGPGNYTFDVCGTHVAMFDTGNGGLATSVEARISDMLHRGSSKFLLAGMHHPAFPGATAAGWSQEDQAQLMLVELALQNADLLITGHVHGAFDFPKVPVGDRTIHQIIVGTAGARQGSIIPVYGYLRLSVGERIQHCFVEVLAPGAKPGVGDIPGSLKRCSPSSTQL